MKKIAFLLFFMTLLGCGSTTTPEDLLPYVAVNENVNLDLPQFVNLQVPGGWAYVSGGLKGIIVYNINGTQFKAFERAAPHLPLSKTCSRMDVVNGFKMVCPCDDSEFNILNGAPLTSGINYFARDYLVTNLNGAVLRITNF